MIFIHSMFQKFVQNFGFKNMYSTWRAYSKSWSNWLHIINMYTINASLIYVYHERGKNMYARFRQWHVSQQICSHLFIKDKYKFITCTIGYKFMLYTFSKYFWNRRFLQISSLDDVYMSLLLTVLRKSSRAYACEYFIELFSLLSLRFLSKIRTHWETSISA